MLEGTLTTIELFILTLAISLPLGLPVALGSNSHLKPLSFLCTVYVWVFRGTPLLLQLYFFYFFFRLFWTFRPVRFLRSSWHTCSITRHTSRRYTERNQQHRFRTVRRGSRPRLSKGQTMIDIILPQTMKAILPPTVNEAITLVKDTALASTLPIIDLMKATNSAVNRTTDMTPFFFAALLYLLMTFVLTIIAGRLEKHFSRYDAKGDR